jgi:CTP synthase
MYKNTKFIFVTGGVLSSLGKGLSAASLGALLEARGYSVRMMKMDPYLNVDPGTMNPFQHGEVYVTEDGAETDLDLGHYERFTSKWTSKKSNLTSGMVYFTVLENERRGDYLGQTVQVIPHVTDEIKRRIKELPEQDDFVIVEIGGTVGDIESLPFLEAIRQIRYDIGKQNVLYIHVTLLPYMRQSDEIKTKPTQHSVRALMEVGIQPDILICRTEEPIGQSIKEKISLFCNVKPSHVIEAVDVDCIYEVPLNFRKEALDKIVLESFNMWYKDDINLSPWIKFIDNEIKSRKKESIIISMVGKYSALPESYKSLNEALSIAGVHNGRQITINHIDTDTIHLDETKYIIKDYLAEGCSGILIPGGFGSRGIEEKISVIKYARENNIPFLGICLGMQLAVVEYARNVCGMDDANSEEFDKDTPYPVVYLMPSQKGVHKKGGTMRLGAYSCEVVKDTLAYKIYGDSAMERHRHRYEINSEYTNSMINKGLVISGLHFTAVGYDLVEIVELPENDFFMGVQFHPEFTAKPLNSHPLFDSFISACINYSKK